jgi:hypothetical protein
MTPERIWYYEVWSERRKRWLDTSFCARQDAKPRRHILKGRKDRWRDGGTTGATEAHRDTPAGTVNGCPCLDCRMLREAAAREGAGVSRMTGKAGA